MVHGKKCLANRFCINGLADVTYGVTWHFHLSENVMIGRRRKRNDSDYLINFWIAINLNQMEPQFHWKHRDFPRWCGDLAALPPALALNCGAVASGGSCRIAWQLMCVCLRLRPLLCAATELPQSFPKVLIQHDENPCDRGTLTSVWLLNANRARKKSRSEPCGKRMQKKKNYIETPRNCTFAVSTCSTFGGKNVLNLAFIVCV